MPKILVFDLKSKIAHFRLPDTTVTHGSYPFIPRTTLHGLLASILGLKSLESPVDLDRKPEYEPEHFVGIRLMAPVKSAFQKLSMLGKGWAPSGSAFNRPVSLEILVNPHYRVFYKGPYVKELETMIEQRCSKYHTYMGSCYCLVFPEYVDAVEARKYDVSSEWISTRTVVPSFVVDKLHPQPGSEYARAGGLHYRYLGGRQFSGTLNMVYEVCGNPLVFKPNTRVIEERKDPAVRFYEFEGGEIICMW